MANIQERINSKGIKSYRAQIRIKGYKQQSATFERKTDAKDWASRTESDMRRGKYLEQTESERHTLAELINRYIANEVPKRNSDHQKVIMQLNWWKDQIGHLLLKDIKPSILAEMRDKLLKSPPHRNAHYKKPCEQHKTKGPATVKRYMASLSHALSIATKEWEWLQSNPMLNVSKPQLPQERVRFLENDERKNLLKACQSSPSPYLHTVVVLALSTGARYSEIMHLKWSDIDLNRGRAVLHNTKNKERRTLHIVGEAHKALQKHQKALTSDSEYVFPRKDGLAPIEIRKQFEKAIQRAGIKDFRFHDLRHSAASYLAMNGASNREISEVLGHKNLQMVKRYAHLSDEHSARVVEKMNEKIFS